MADTPRVYDSDEKFLGVINRVDSSNLEPGYVSKAVNRLFDRSVIKNRWGVIRPNWGGKFTADYRTVTASTTSNVVSVVGGNAIPESSQVYSDPSISYVGSVTVTTPGSGYTNGIGYSLGISGGGGSGAAGTFVVSGGGIASVTITSAGSGYTSTPTLSFSSAGAGGGQVVSTTMVQQFIYDHGARAISDDGVNVTLDQTSLGWNANSRLYYFAGIEAFTDIVGILTYREPVSGLDVLLVASNEARDDGGQGAVYVVRPGQTHSSIFTGESFDSIPMNGHDFYGPVNMVQCGDGVIMLRSGLTRYYFTGLTPIDESNDRIALSVEPTEISTGDKVLLIGLNEGFANLGAATSQTIYYARSISGSTEVELYDTRQNAEELSATTGRVELTATSDSYRYYLSVVDPKNFWTHQQQSNLVMINPSVDAPPLIMQASTDLANPVSVGFDSLGTVSVSSADTATGLFTCENHRLVPGDGVKFMNTTGLTNISGSTVEEEVLYYVYPVDPNTFYVYRTLDAALANQDDDSRQIPTATGTADISKSGVSGGPMPNCREALYFGNRVFGIYGPDFVAISDILNPLIYLPLQNEFRLNSGTNDKVVAIYPFNESTIIVFKQRSVLAIANSTGELDGVRLIEITRDYGCVASKSIASTGSDIVWLSQRGVVSLKQTEYGLTQSVVIPLSDPIQGTIDKIDWANASGACAAYHDNKYILSVPVGYGDGTNQLTIAYNFLNQSWDGEWSGTMLVPRFFERLYVNGTTRLVFADESGFIHFFDPLAYKDRAGDGSAVEIETEVETRGYTCGTKEHKQWTESKLAIATWDPEYAIDSVLDDYNAVKELKPYTTKSRTEYYTYGTEDYDATNANDDFDTANREDYSVVPGFVPGSNGVKFGVKQTIVEKTRPTGHSSAIRIKFTTTQGSVDIKSSFIAGIPFRQFGSTDN